MRSLLLIAAVVGQGLCRPALAGTAEDLVRALNNRLRMHDWAAIVGELDGELRYCQRLPAEAIVLAHLGPVPVRWDTLRVWYDTLATPSPLLEAWVDTLSEAGADSAREAAASQVTVVEQAEVRRVECPRPPLDAAGFPPDLRTIEIAGLLERLGPSPVEGVGTLALVPVRDQQTGVHLARTDDLLERRFAQWDLRRLADFRPLLYLDLRYDGPELESSAADLVSATIRWSWSKTKPSLHTAWYVDPEGNTGEAVVAFRRENERWVFADLSALIAQLVAVTRDT